MGSTSLRTLKILVLLIGAFLLMMISSTIGGLFTGMLALVLYIIVKTIEEKAIKAVAMEKSKEDTK